MAASNFSELCCQWRTIARTAASSSAEPSFDGPACTDATLTNATNPKIVSLMAVEYRRSARLPQPAAQAGRPQGNEFQTALIGVFPVMSYSSCRVPHLSVFFSVSHDRVGAASFGRVALPFAGVTTQKVTHPSRSLCALTLVAWTQAGEEE